MTGCDPGGCRFESYYLPFIRDSFQDIKKLNILNPKYNTNIKNNLLIILLFIKILHTIPLTKSLTYLIYNHKFIPTSVQKKPQQLNTPKLNVQFFHKKLQTSQLNVFFKKTFKTFLHLTLPTSNFPFKTYHSLNNSYITNTTKNSPNIFSIIKFIKNYNNVWGFIYNIFFYNIKTLFFGPPFLKKELCSLNFTNLNTLNFNLKFKNLLLFTIPLTRQLVSTKVIKFIINFKINNAFVFDTHYHKVTLNYLKNLTVVTIGIIPITSNPNALDVSLVVMDNSIFSQIFTTTLILNIKKNTEYSKYNLLSNQWAKFLIKQ